MNVTTAYIHSSFLHEVFISQQLMRNGDRRQWNYWSIAGQSISMGLVVPGNHVARGNMVNT
jgi:hypothetical protein